MAEVFDIRLDETGESVYKNGDYDITESTLQHTSLLIVCGKAENKMAPESGVGINSWLLDESGPIDLKRETQAEMEADGQRVDYLRFEENGEYNVAGTYQ